jgi:chemotaxis protein CheD
MEPSAPQHFFDRELKVRTVMILPGQCHASSGPGSISTMLGSCVSTCLWDPVTRIGGMNHFMLPGESGSTRSPWGASARFGIYAMELVINDMVRLGADRRRLVAKVFGGARVLHGFDTLDVGAKNSEFVLDFLREERIELLAQDLLGVSPRKVHFFPETGKVQMRKLQLQRSGEVQRDEREYLARLAGQPVVGEVEIFERAR